MTRFGIRRSIALLALAALALSGGAHALANGLALKKPSLALALNPDHPGALSMAAEAALARGGGIEAMKGLAIAALLSNPMEARAAYHLGMVRQLDGDEQAATDLLTYSLTLSRRVTQTHLWWIEYWAREGDLERTLSHYDRVLRISSSASAVLFPTLVNAARDPLIASELARLMSRSAPWQPLYLQQLAQSGQPRAILTQFLALARADHHPSVDLLNTALQRLLDLGEYADAFNLYSEMTGKPGRDAIRPLPRGDGARSIFDWHLADGTSSFFENGTLILQPDSRGRALAAQQLVWLSRGVIQIQFFMEQGEGLDPRIQCLGRPLPVVQRTTRDLDIVTLTAEIPDDCGHQELKIYSIAGREVSAVKAVHVDKGHGR